MESCAAAWLRGLGLGVLVLGLVSCGGSSGGGGGGGATHVVTLLLAAPSSPFALGAPVEIEATLRNDGTVPTNVTSYVRGALRIVGAERDNSPLPVTTTNVDTEEDLRLLLEDGLTPLAPGASLTFTLRSRTDSLVGGQSFSVYRPGSPSDEEDIIGLAAAGAYEVEMRYDGPVPAGATVFSTPTAPATVTFAIAP